MYCIEFELVVTFERKNSGCIAPSTTCKAAPTADCVASVFKIKVFAKDLQVPIKSANELEKLYLLLFCVASGHPMEKKAAAIAVGLKTKQDKLLHILKIIFWWKYDLTTAIYNQK